MLFNLPRDQSTVTVNSNLPSTLNTLPINYHTTGHPLNIFKSSTEPSSPRRIFSSGELKSVDSVLLVLIRLTLSDNFLMVYVTGTSPSSIHYINKLMNRVVFAILAMEHPHVILLDEPTNHLDMESIDSLAKAIKEFSGGVVIVSHDFRMPPFSNHMHTTRLINRTHFTSRRRSMGGQG